MPPVGASNPRSLQNNNDLSPWLCYTSMTCSFQIIFQPVRRSTHHLGTGSLLHIVHPAEGVATCCRTGRGQHTRDTFSEKSSVCTPDRWLWRGLPMPLLLLMGWESGCQPASAQQELPGSKQEQQQSSSRRTLVLSLGVLLTAAAAVAALLSVLCVTALSCSASPHLSVTVRGSSGQQQGSPHAGAASGVSWTGSSCPIGYKQFKQQDNQTAPLLLGGIAAGCVTRCQPRASMW